MSKKFIITLVSLVVLALATGIVIFLAKGYSFSPTEKRIIGTGIISVSSEPDSASVFVDGHLTTATNATISSLTPKNYSIRIVKEGFIPWEKQVTVREGIVTELKVTLFPAIPTIYPLTFNGVTKPILSPDGSKLVFIVPSSTTQGAINRKAGVWVWTLMKNQPIAFARASEPHQIASSAFSDFSQADLRWSADSKQVVATVEQNSYLLEADRLNNEPRDITPILSATLKSWDDDIKSKDDSRISAIEDINMRKIASDSAVVHWSPDETKILVRVSDFKVYDLEEVKEYSIPEARAHIWLPDSRHIILVGEKEISIVDFDGSNKAVIFAGSFLDNFVFPWPDSSRLVIISSFPTPTASEPNLYGINLR